MKLTTKRIDELGQVIGGATPSTNNPDYWDGDISWITPKDLTGYQNRYISSGSRNITKLGLDHSSAKILPPGSILFSSRAPIGYMAISATSLCTNQGFKSIIPNNNTDSLFLYYLLQHNKSLIASHGSGTTFKEVSGSVMSSIELQVPEDKKDQIRIASIFDALDTKIELNYQINDYLEQAMQIVFNKFCVLNNPEYGSIYDIADIIYGAPFLSEYFNENKIGWPLIRIRDLNTFMPQFYTDEQHPKRTFIEPGEVLVGMDAEFKATLWLGSEGVLNQRVCYFRPRIDRSITPSYLYLALKPLLAYIQNYASGTTVAHMGKSDLESLKVPLPSLEGLKKFNKIAEPMRLNIVKNAKESSTLGELRNALLPKLMSGEIDVAQVDIMQLNNHLSES